MIAPGSYQKVTQLRRIPIPEARATDANHVLVAQTEIFDLKTGLCAVISNPFWLWV